MSWPPPPEIVSSYTIGAVTIALVLWGEARDRAKARRRNVLERLEHLERLELVRRRYRQALDDPPSPE